MIDIKECEKVEIPQGAMYLGPSTDEFSEGYLELNPFTSLTLHNRLGGIENLTQVDNACVMVVFTSDIGENHKLNPGDVLNMEPEGVWHSHVNPF